MDLFPAKNAFRVGKCWSRLVGWTVRNHIFFSPILSDSPVRRMRQFRGISRIMAISIVVFDFLVSTRLPAFSNFSTRLLLLRISGFKFTHCLPPLIQRLNRKFQWTSNRIHARSMFLKSLQSPCRQLMRSIHTVDLDTMTTARYLTS